MASELRETIRFGALGWHERRRLSAATPAVKRTRTDAEGEA